MFRQIGAVALGVLGTFAAALLLVLGATLWLPAGPGGVDHLMLPVVAFPLVWTGLILWVFLARARRRVWALLGVLGAGHAVVLWLSTT